MGISVLIYAHFFRNITTGYNKALVEESARVDIWQIQSTNLAENLAHMDSRISNEVREGWYVRLYILKVGAHL